MFFVVALVLSSIVYSGCSKGFSGDPLANSRPEVRFVNVPPDGSIFSANPIVNWIGTDIDGRIVEFRYVVALVSDVPAGMTPEEYALSNIPFKEWTVKTVTLDDPASRDTVSLAADFANPVTVFIQQYMFLVAVDDKGAISSIVYRTFGRNDHFPDTRVAPIVAAGGAFVNVVQQQFGQGGIPLDWTGTDPLDFPGVEEGIPLEFEWRFFGPYTQAESTLIIDSFVIPVFLATTNVFNIGDTLIDTTFDFTKTDTLVDSTFAHAPDSLGNTLDSFLTVSVHIDKVDTLEIDTTAAARLLLADFGAFDSILDLARLDSLDLDSLNTDSSSRLIRFSYDPVTKSTWTTDRSVNLFDVFRDDPSVVAGSGADTTRQNSFLFWVRSRDDAFVPDPTPFFSLLPVINPRHERDLLILTFNSAVRRRNHNGAYMPCGENAATTATQSYNLVKGAFAGYLDKWIPGFVGPDGNFGFDTGSFQPCFDDSLVLTPAQFAVCGRQKAWGTAPDFLNVAAFSSPFSATLRDVLKHKVVIFLKENLNKEFGFGQELGDPNQFLVQGLLSGNNYWTLGRSSFQAKAPLSDISLIPYQYGISTSSSGLSPTYAQLFGIQGGFEPAWVGMAGQRVVACDPNIGCLPAVRSEDFIGAATSELVSSSDFPALSVDTSRLRNMLLWTDRNTCSRDFIVVQQFPYMDSIAALPDVGFTIPTTSRGTETLYLYKSRFGEAKYPFWDLDFGDMQGTVVAVRLDGGFFRTSHWQFTPIPLDPVSFQPAFNTMMDWLFARPWGGPSFGSPVQPVAPPSGKYASQYLELTRSIEANRQDLINEAFAGKRYFKNQLEYEQQLHDYMEMKSIQAAADEQSY